MTSISKALAINKGSMDILSFNIWSTQFLSFKILCLIPFLFSLPFWGIKFISVGICHYIHFIWSNYSHQRLFMLRKVLVVSIPDILGIVRYLAIIGKWESVIMSQNLKNANYQLGIKKTLIFDTICHGRKWIEHLES